MCMCAVRCGHATRESTHQNDDGNDTERMRLLLVTLRVRVVALLGIAPPAPLRVCAVTHSVVPRSACFHIRNWPRIRRLNCMSLTMIVTRRAWIAQMLLFGGASTATKQGTRGEWMSSWVGETARLVGTKAGSLQLVGTTCNVAELHRVGPPE